MPPAAPPSSSTSNTKTPPKEPSMPRRCSKTQSPLKITSSAKGTNMKTELWRKVVGPAVLFVGLLVLAGAAAAQQVIPVWPGPAPGSENWTQKEAQSVNPNGTSFRNVVNPSL